MTRQEWESMYDQMGDDDRAVIERFALSFIAVRPRPKSTVQLRTVSSNGRRANDGLGGRDNVALRLVGK